MQIVVAVSTKCKFPLFQQTQKSPLTSPFKIKTFLLFAPIWNSSENIDQNKV